MATDHEYTLEDWLDDMAQISGVQVWNPIMKCWVWEDDGVPVGSQPVEPKKEGR